jgi:hypothetical protein
MVILVRRPLFSQVVKNTNRALEKVLILFGNSIYKNPHYIADDSSN